MAFAYLCAVHGHRDCCRLATLFTLAFVLEVDYQLHPSLREWVIACNCRPLEFQIVVHERRFVLAHVEAVPADESTVRIDHAFCSADGDFDVCSECPRLVE